MKHYLTATVFALSSVVIASTSPVSAAEGDLVNTFGSAGKVITRIGTPQQNYAQAATSVALTSDNNIVVAGHNTITTEDFLVAKYSTSGVADSNFGVGGYFTADFSSSADRANAVAVQQNGYIVAAGSSGPSGNALFALARFTPDGGLDPAFGTGGKTRIVLGVNDDIANAVFVQPDGKIVAAGVASNNFVVVRFNTDGSLDTSFNGNGIVTTDIGGTDAAYGLALQPDGKIIAVGKGNNDFAVVRYNTDGSLDTSFDGNAGNGNGIVRTDITPANSRIDTATSVALQPDGKIVVAGYYASVPNKSAVVRYNSNGTLDTTFDGSTDGNGIVTLSFSTGADLATSVALQPDGKIVIGGMGGIGIAGTEADFVVARLKSDGTSDSSFAGGQKSIDFDQKDDKALGLVLLGDGDIVQVGGSIPQTSPNANQDIALARVSGDETAPTASLARTGSGVLTNGQTENVAITLSERSTDFVANDVVVTNGTIQAFEGSGTAYSVRIVPIAQSLGKVTVSIPAGAFSDQGGNPNTIANSLLIDFDTLRTSGSASGSGSQSSTFDLLKYSAGNKKISFTFPAVSNATRFTLKNRSGRNVCDTTSRTCTVRNLKNGVLDTYVFSFTNLAGELVADVSSIRAMAGFHLGIASAKVRSRVLLKRVITSPSTGTKRWSITSGKCRIRGAYVVMPTTRGRCTVRIRVAKKGLYPAMTASVRITVTK